MLTRNEVLSRAHDDCLREMYAKAQPSANFDEIVEGVKNGTIKDDAKNPVYSRYYLSAEEFNHILKKYKKAYGIDKPWNRYLDVVEDYFKGRGLKDIWVEGKVEPDGFKSPGHRSAEEVPHITKAFNNILKTEFAMSLSDEDLEEISDRLSVEVLKYTDWCRNFYMFDREESSFSAGIALGCSPTSNPNTVIEYWKAQGVDIDIKWRNPLLLWEMDEFGDGFEEYMVDEYGEDWEQYWKDEWEKRKNLKNYGYDD